MCTLIALWKIHPAAPLILALNRDEFLARPTESPRLWDHLDPPRPIVAGRDLRSGGTWFGVGRNVVAGLTNDRSGGRAPAAELSRGDLVVNALLAGSVAEARTELETAEPGAYGGFHLLACDATSMVWTTNSGGAIESHDVESGIHVLGNYGLDNPDDPIVANLMTHLRGVEDMDEGELIEFLKSTLGRTGAPWPCVRMGPYGTCSSTILMWGGGADKLWSTDGPPDQSPWIERSELLSQL